MIIALGVLFVTSLILAAVFVAANGDVKLTRTDTNQKKAYYAALAGLSAYKFHLNSEADYWKKCPSLPTSGTGTTTVPGTGDESYAVNTMPSTGHSESECKSGQQAAILETSGSAHGTFRVKSVGTAGTGTQKSTRTLVATFNHPGFINYVYFTNYEILDPAAQNPEPTVCEHYYAYREENHLTTTCGTIVFAANDKINGPMHTNDAAALCGESTSKPTFGRKGYNDKIEMNGGHYGGCGSSSNQLTINGEYTEKGATLTPPTSDSELIEAAGLKLKGKVFLELKTGVPNTVAIRHENINATPEIKNFPANGVIYVENNGSCPVKYTPFGSNYEGDTNCGNAYVKGEYTESLTIAAANDVIINGNLITSHESSGKPTGSAVLGLIATNFVRIYHPVTKEYSATAYTPKTEAPGGPSGNQCETLVNTTSTHTGTLTSGKKEVTSIVTGELGVGEEVVGTGIPAETTIESKTANAIVLTKNATASGSKSLTFYRAGVLTNNKKEVTSISTTNLANGEEVAGTGIPTGTTITLGTNKITLSKNATVSGIERLTFYKSTGYEYYSGINKCVEKLESGYTYHESENLYAKCNSTKDQYTSSGHCEYQNTSEGCRAPNLETFEPTIDAAMLSTAHSFIVDNFKCGEHLGNLNVWGSIAQDWRGAVGQSEAGYTKNYNYDDRLETLQPPDFLTPTSTTLTLTRVNAIPNS